MKTVPRLTRDPSAATDASPRNRSRTPPRATHDVARQGANPAPDKCLVAAKSPGHSFCKLQFRCSARRQHELTLQAAPSRLALSLDCLRVPHCCEVATFLGKLQRGLISSKLLDEPHSTSSAQQLAIASLRYLAPRLGQTWRYNTGPNAPHVADDSDPEVSSNASGEPIVLHFAILSLGFVPEHVVVTVSLPETTATIITQLQSARANGSAEAFPTLLPASPQPCPWLRCRPSPPRMDHRRLLPVCILVPGHLHYRRASFCGGEPHIC